MKKYCAFGFLSVFLFSLVNSQALSQTSDEILEKMIEAQGGRKLLETIKDMTLTASMEMIQMGLSGTMTMYQKEPNKMRMDMELMGMKITQAFDGEHAWGINPQTGNTMEMPDQAAEEMKRQALGNDALLHPEKYGISFSFKGKEKSEDKEYFVLEQTFSDGFKATLYIDPETYLAHKTKATTVNQMGVEVESETIQSDYKKVEGAMVAHSLMIYQGGAEYLTLTVSEIKFNTGLEDSFFVMNK